MHSTQDDAIHAWNLRMDERKKFSPLERLLREYGLVDKVEIKTYRVKGVYRAFKAPVDMILRNDDEEYETDVIGGRDYILEKEDGTLYRRREDHFNNMFEPVAVEAAESKDGEDDRVGKRA
jgi:hypothetical protein